MEINADYVIRRTILFDNKCGFVLGENPKAPNPYVTWQFNEQDGHRDYFWGHYHNEPDKLRAIVQEQIDRIEAGDDPGTYCGKNGSVGIESIRYTTTLFRGFHSGIQPFL